MAQIGEAGKAALLIARQPLEQVRPADDRGRGGKGRHRQRLDEHAVERGEIIREWEPRRCVGEHRVERLSA